MCRTLAVTLDGRFPPRKLAALQLCSFAAYVTRPAWGHLGAHQDIYGGAVFMLTSAAYHLATWPPASSGVRHTQFSLLGLIPVPSLPTFVIVIIWLSEPACGLSPPRRWHRTPHTRERMFLAALGLLVSLCSAYTQRPVRDLRDAHDATASHSHPLVTAAVPASEEWSSTTVTLSVPVRRGREVS